MGRLHREGAVSKAGAQCSSFSNHSTLSISQLEMQDGIRASGRLCPHRAWAEAFPPAAGEAPSETGAGRCYWGVLSVGCHHRALRPDRRAVNGEHRHWLELAQWVLIRDSVFLFLSVSWVDQ